MPKTVFADIVVEIEKIVLAVVLVMESLDRRV
jgi:hypothetical protein